MIPLGGIRRSEAMSEATYRVPGMSCGHCEQAVSRELLAVEGVESVDVDLETKLVVVHGEGLDDVRLRGAIDEAGYEAAQEEKAR
jgi:copper chaperone